MPNPWGSIGSWAAEADKAEEEEKSRSVSQEKAKPAPVLANESEEAFPSLGQASSVKPKKKKGQTMSIHQFVASTIPTTAAKQTKPFIAQSDKLTYEEQLSLPTAPRERDESEAAPSLGGGFRNYGNRNYPSGGRDGGREERGGRGRDGGYERDREGGFNRNRDRGEAEGPSRADESSNWSSVKSFSSDRQPLRRYEGLGSDKRPSDRDGASRADEVDNWAKEKQFVPSSGGSAMDRDRYGPRRGFEEPRERKSYGDFSSSRAGEVDNWKTAKSYTPAPSRSFDPSSRDPGTRSYDSHPRDFGSDGDRWGRRDAPRDAPVEAPTSGERPKLNLQKRTVPLETPPTPSESLPSPKSVADRPAPKSPGSNQPRPKLNPFGSARPREEVLAEKGTDWKKVGSDYAGSEPRSSNPSSRQNSRPQTPESADMTSISRSKLPVATEPKTEPRAEDSGKGWRKIALGLENKNLGRPQTEEEKKLSAEIAKIQSLLERSNLLNGKANEASETSDQNGFLSTENGVDEDHTMSEKEREEIQLLKGNYQSLKKDLEKLKSSLDERYNSQKAVREVERWEKSNQSMRNSGDHGHKAQDGDGYGRDKDNFSSLNRTRRDRSSDERNNSFRRTSAW